MIWFIRHGESEANLKGVFAGQKGNSPLTKLGKEQAKQAAKDVQAHELKIDKLIASKILRTKQTAEIVAKEIGFPIDRITYDDRVIEYDMGDLTGTPIRKVSSKELTQSRNAEDVNKFKDRVSSFLDEYRKSNKVILLVSHAGVGRMIQTIDRGLPAIEFYNLDPFSNGSVNKID